MFSISFASLPYGGKKNPETKRGRYQPTHQRHKILSQFHSNFQQWDSHYQNISSSPWLPKGGSLPPASVWKKPRSVQVHKASSLSALKVRAVIRNKGQLTAEPCLESVRDKHLAVQVTNKQYVPPLLWEARALSPCGLQDQILNAHSQILSANYSDIAAVQITSEIMMSLEKKKNNFSNPSQNIMLTHIILST